MNQHPIDIDLALTLAENRRRELTRVSQQERLLEQAGMATQHHSPRRALGHGLIRLGYALMAPRDRIPPRALNPVHF
jgi:hypothetical protein